MTRLLCLLLVLAGALLGSSAEAARELDLLVTAERLFDGVRVIQDGGVAIDGGRIVAVGRRSRLPATARRVRSFSDATIVPGLVDLHTHGLGGGQEASPVTTVRDSRRRSPRSRYASGLAHRG
jgi:imidazolonepropionase-like amidohydrolase